MAKETASGRTAIARVILARQARRRTRLRDRRVSQLTLLRYKQALAILLKWWSSSGNCPSVHGCVDTCAGLFVEHLWASNAGLSEARYSLAALQFFLPSVRKRLPYSWDLIRAWQKAEPPSRAAPFTPLITLAVAGCFLAVNAPRMAGCCVMAFAALLRTGEIFVLLRKHLAFSVDLARVVITIPRSKSGNRFGTKELVVIECPVAARFMWKIFGHLNGNDPLADFSLHKFRAAFNIILTTLDLQGFGFNLYSFRRGGATADFLRHGSAEKTLLRGRWQNLATARLYLQEGVAALVDIRIDAARRETLHTAAGVFQSFGF